MLSNIKINRKRKKIKICCHVLPTLGQTFVTKFEKTYTAVKYNKREFTFEIL